MMILPSFSSTSASSFAEHSGQSEIVLYGTAYGKGLMGAPVRVFLSDGAFLAMDFTLADFIKSQ